MIIHGHTPIILLAGSAGSGKDTAGSWISQNYRGVTVAQADPLKRFVKDVFGFSVEQLWGPSNSRNAAVPELQDRMGTIISNFDAHAEDWIEEILPDFDFDTAMESLKEWFGRTLSSITEAPASPRKVLQTLGTDWGRTLSPHMWVNYAVELSMALLEGDLAYDRYEGPMDKAGESPELVIITDGRFKNELLTVRSLNGVAMKIERNTNRRATDDAGIAGHRSESELDSIPSHFYSTAINNNSSMDSLYYNLAEAMQLLFGITRKNTP